MKLDLFYGLQILQEVQQKYPEAIIAGGFLRDLFFGKEFKDIDIFVSWQSPLHLGSYDFPDDFIESSTCDMSYSTDNEIANVDKLYFSVEMHYPENYVKLFELNIIEVQAKDLAARVQEHDFDFCQVYTDGKQIYGANILQQILDTKTITLVQCENAKQWQRSMKRWDRFQEKYPGFKLKIKEGIYRE